jgi:NADH dehydrogenase FAD-containing subunit
MEFSRVQVSRPSFQDFKKGLDSQHLFAEVVLLDKSTDGAYPQLYQLSKDHLTPFENLEILRQNFISLPHPAFILVGEIIKIDMAKKTIVLTNDNVVTYKFLILVVEHGQRTEISTVLHALKDALILESLDLKSKISQSNSSKTRVHTTPDEKKQLVHSFRLGDSNYQPIEEIAKHKLPDSHFSHNLHHLQTSSKPCFLQM